MGIWQQPYRTVYIIRTLHLKYQPILSYYGNPVHSIIVRMRNKRTFSRKRVLFRKRTCSPKIPSLSLSPSQCRTVYFPRQQKHVSRLCSCSARVLFSWKCCSRVYCFRIVFSSKLFSCSVLVSRTVLTQNSRVLFSHIAIVYCFRVLCSCSFITYCSSIVFACIVFVYSVRAVVLFS